MERLVKRPMVHFLRHRGSFILFRTASRNLCCPQTARVNFSFVTRQRMPENHLLLFASIWPGPLTSRFPPNFWPSSCDVISCMFLSISSKPTFEPLGIRSSLRCCCILSRSLCNQLAKSIQPALILLRTSNGILFSGVGLDLQLLVILRPCISLKFVS